MPKVEGIYLLHAYVGVYSGTHSSEKACTSQWLVSARNNSGGVLVSGCMTDIKDIMTPLPYRGTQGQHRNVRISLHCCSQRVSENRSSMLMASQHQLAYFTWHNMTRVQKARETGIYTHKRSRESVQLCMLEWGLDEVHGNSLNHRVCTYLHQPL